MKTNIKKLFKRYLLCIKTRNGIDDRRRCAIYGAIFGTVILYTIQQAYAALGSIR